MIKATELRLGNYLEFKDYPTRYYTKVDMKILKIIHEYPENHTWFDIPLTPQILEQCGFENNNGEWDCKYQELALFKNHNDSPPAYNAGSWQMQVERSDVFNVNLSYLHQLQNLMFALTGEELEVKSLHAAL